MSHLLLLLCSLWMLKTIWALWIWSRNEIMDHRLHDMKCLIDAENILFSQGYISRFNSFRYFWRLMTWKLMLSIRIVDILSVKWCLRVYFYAPATFHVVMNWTLDDFIQSFMFVYIHDFLIFFRNEKNHLKHIETVLSRLKEQNLLAASRRCEFIETRIHFLGLIVEIGGFLSILRRPWFWSRDRDQRVFLAQELPKFAPALLEGYQELLWDSCSSG